MRFFPTLALACIAVVSISSNVAKAELLYGIGNNDPSVGQSLYIIDSETQAVNYSVVLQTPGVPLAPLSSIDVRPANGQLYGLLSSIGSSQLFTINPATGAATALGGPLPAASLIDFNPTVDAIRLIDPATNSNYRVNATTGALIMTDGTLAYGAGDANNGSTPVIRGNGYTNSEAGATSTTLYNIDTDKDTLVTQTPANAGTLQTVGSLGFNANTGLFGGGFVGFDISGSTDTAYLTDSSFGNPTNFYTVDLSTGLASLQGTISGLGDRSLVAIATGAVAVPEPATIGIVAIGAMCLIGRRLRAK